MFGILITPEREKLVMSQMHWSYSRIDCFSIAKKELHRVKDSYVEPNTISDHGLVTLSMCLGSEEHFKYWRLRVSLLTDPSLQQELQRHLIDYLSSMMMREFLPLYCGKELKQWWEGQWGYLQTTTLKLQFYLLSGLNLWQESSDRIHTVTV